ncbi:MAG TPA: hypothetical protein PLS50_07680 [Candidatus Dojkabacteria bacterium]|nr:hypothetical protein [Candidatus Dojkabacteria bacterium]
MEVPLEKKPKRQLTDKQKAARIDNLAKGRKKRMEMIKQKREMKEQEYDISSDESYDSDSSSGSDNDAFVISKAKKKPMTIREPPQKQKRHISKHAPTDTHLRQDVDELKNMIIELASMQKKQHKERREPKRSSGGTKIVVLPQQGAGAQPKHNDDYMEKLRKSIFD